MEYVLVILGSSVSTSLIIYLIYLNLQIRDLKDKVDIQDSFIFNLRKDIENLHFILEKTEDSFQNDIRRHIEDLREDLNVDTKNIYNYFKEATHIFDSFVDKSKSPNEN